jgi:hypothetical protein
VARTLHVYPKAVIVGGSWSFVVKVFDQDLRTNSRFVHTIPAGVTAEIPMRLLKLSFDMTVPDINPDTLLPVIDSDIDDALFVLDIKPGGQTATVWSNWQDTAETNIDNLSPGYTQADFYAEWSKQNTSKVRNDARRALVTLQTGWSVDVGSVHQHEGDGTVTES